MYYIKRLFSGKKQRLVCWHSNSTNQFFFGIRSGEGEFWSVEYTNSVGSKYSVVGSNILSTPP